MTACSVGLFSLRVSHWLLHLSESGIFLTPHKTFQRNRYAQSNSNWGMCNYYQCLFLTLRKIQCKHWKWGGGRERERERECLCAKLTSLNHSLSKTIDASVDGLTHTHTHTHHSYCLKNSDRLKKKRGKNKL